MMLSLISERTANFAKIHFQGKQIIIPYIHFDRQKKLKFYLSVTLKILAYEQPTQAMEKEREYRIQVINILIGIMIAAFANANFFDIIEQIRHSQQTIAVTGWKIEELKIKHLWGLIYLITFIWSVSLMLFNRLQEGEEKANQKFVRFPFIIWITLTLILLLISINAVKGSELCKDCYSIIIHTIGYIFTGLFLSLGSKFWHDFLDILLKLKNTQQTLSDSKTYTNYDSADKLLSLAETSHSEIAQKLYDLYNNDISNIKGVLSRGLNTVQDQNTKMFKRVIEVEFNTAQAQTGLLDLSGKSSIVINLNTFYLKDYLVMRYSEKIKAINAGLTRPTSCYAHNSNAPGTFGSFWVYEKDNKYYAVSNLHVFADPSEFKKFEKTESYKLLNTKVTFVMQNVIHPDKGTIMDYRFGDLNGYGIDLCTCKISKSVFDQYNNIINTNYLQNPPADSMRMFGAISKYKEFKNKLEHTICDVSYPGFKNISRLNLIKLEPVDGNNAQPGDSGSVVHFQITTASGKESFTGMLVAQSSNYAYMFRFYN